MSKTHAKDYLIEYANSLDKDWLKCLIIETINTNGNISNEKLEEITSVPLKFGTVKNL